MVFETEKSQIAQARQTLAQQKQELSETEQQVQSFQVPRRSLEFQQQYQSRAGRIEQTIAERKRIKQQAIGTIAEQKKQIAITEQQVEQASQQVGESENYQQQFELGMKRAIEGKGMPAFPTRAEREGYKFGSAQVKSYKQQKQQAELFKSMEEGAMIDPKTGMGYSIAPSVAPSSYVSFSSVKQADYIDELGQGYSGMIPEVKEIKQEGITKPLGIVEPFTYPKDATKTEKKLFQIEESIRKMRRKGGASAFLAGALTVGKETVQFGYGLFTKPKETIKQFGIGTYAFGKRLVTGEGYPQLGKILYQEPSYAFGYASATAFSLKSSTAVTKTSDFFRTIKLKEIPTEKIVAPEFFAGQRYPAIKKGQTAGELLEEFKPILPGETRPAGFTASPKPVKGAILPGTSEIPGLYQAPKLSPAFLRVGGEKKLIGFNMFDTIRPTATRITPEKIELVPGITKKTKTIKPELLKDINEFYKTKAERGKSYVPFIKTEKEAIIPAGTQLIPTQKRFYFKFEGRRIPIQEFETLKGNVTLPIKRKIFPAKKIYSRYSLRVKRSSIINPYSSFIYSSKLTRYEISSKKRPSFREDYPDVFKRYSNKSSNNIYNFGRSYNLSSTTSRDNYSTNVSNYYGRFPFIEGNLPTTQKKISLFGKTKLFYPKKTSQRILSQQTKYTPSFTALALKIKSKKLPKEFGGRETYFAGIRPIISK